MGAACEAENATLQGVGVAALEAVGKLGLAVASLQPFDHSPWSYVFSHYSVQVQVMSFRGGAEWGGAWVAAMMTNLQQWAQVLLVRPWLPRSKAICMSCSMCCCSPPCKGGNQHRLRHFVARWTGGMQHRQDRGVKCRCMQHACCHSAGVPETWWMLVSKHPTFRAVA